MAHRARASARVKPIFRFFLVDEQGEPVTLIIAVPNWSVGETFSIGSAEKFRIPEIGPNSRRR
jgi:hypothetical protein